MCHCQDSTENRRPSIGRRFSFSSMPGVISPAGAAEIETYLACQRPQTDEHWRTLNPEAACTLLPPLPEDWSWLWIVQSGEYRGTFPKRVASYYYKKHSLKCPDSFIQQVGNLSRKHLDSGFHYEFEFVDEFDWHSGDFGDGGSCYWGSNEQAREVLQEHGALAVRFYKDDDGYGRAWFVQTPDFYIVFNGYGYDTLTIARVLSAWMNVQYRKIQLVNNGETSGLVWINGGIGYAIGTPEKIEGIRSFDLRFDVPFVTYCSRCDDRIEREDAVYFGPDDHEYCEDCYYDLFSSCDHCGEVYFDDDLTYVHDSELVCVWCRDRHYSHCSKCGDWHRNADVVIIDQRPYCETCAPAQDEQ